MAAEATTEPAVGCHAASGSLALQELSAEELAWQAGRGCQASFAELVRRYAPRLQAFLQRRTRDRHEAEDLVQDTFVKAYTNLGQYDESWRFSTWLFTIAARTAISHYRRKRHECIRADLPAPACDSTLDRREQRESLWAMAAELPPAQHQALWLKYGEDMSIKDIARVMGKTQVCVKVLLYRARAGLARRLEEAEL